MDILNTGKHVITGIAWTDKGSITKVEISTNNGHTWVNAKANYNGKTAYEWVSWSYEWKAQEKGMFTIMSWATDSYGRIQSSTPAAQKINLFPQNHFSSHFINKK
ncbi:hypothetical protein D0469_08565 [Peribacillus saganii]|uniref:Moybdenum cofactor oxidoreductase dimerisation domain-containing protein n=1 Tax=Peribacillus saganii TaxID=2303992 RepID=A0A372LQ95_9BACI|nr:hypothetical protein [Peribacillus saganii]RFU69852.1 hypothetical protein D0469_08565 [Peribacillus saganii]